MAALGDLLEACRLGRSCRVADDEAGAGKGWLNPYEKGSPERAAWMAGFLNDLDAWMSLSDAGFAG